MIECSGINRVRGKWFYLDCVGLAVEDVPDDDWFCSGRCSSNEKAPEKRGTNSSISSLIILYNLDSHCIVCY